MFGSRIGASGCSLACFTIVSAAESGACADTIKLTHAGHASGRLAGADFPDSAFFVEATADTQDRQVSPEGAYVLVHASATISIKGLGTFEFLTPTQTFVNNEFSVVGFSVENAFDLFDGPTNEAFATWDMLTSTGPHSGDGFILQWMTEDVVTSGGVLVLDDGKSEAPFMAEVTSSCYADFTGDGALDLFDFLAFVNAFNAGEDQADCTGDGSLDLFDFLCSVNAFNAGC